MNRRTFSLRMLFGIVTLSSVASLATARFGAVGFGTSRAAVAGAFLGAAFARAGARTATEPLLATACAAVLGSIGGGVVSELAGRPVRQLGSRQALLVILGASIGTVTWLLFLRRTAGLARADYRKGIVAAIVVGVAVGVGGFLISWVGSEMAPSDLADAIRAHLVIGLLAGGLVAAPCILGYLTSG